MPSTFQLPTKISTDPLVAARKQRALRMIQRAVFDDTIPMGAWIHEADRFGASDAEVREASQTEST